jgi:hypothetical protein
MDYEYELTADDYLIAKENGISRNLAYRRFYQNGWNKQRAITQPVKKGLGSFKELCEQNGISMGTFYCRIQRGLSPEIAATLPVGQKGKRLIPIGIKITDEIIQQAAKNGISENTLKQRVYNYRWPVEKAVNTPVDSSKRRKAQ